MPAFLHKEKPEGQALEQEKIYGTSEIHHLDWDNTLRNWVEAKNSDKERELSKLGMFCKFKGINHLYPGFVDPNIFPRIDVVKRAIVMLVKTSLPMLLIGKVRKRFLMDFGILTLRAFQDPLRSYWLDSNRYCKSGREIYRVLTKRLEPELIGFIRAICITWEYDNAYRFVGQDFFQEYVRHGIWRALNIVKSRHSNLDMKNKIHAIKRALLVLWVFKHSLFRDIIKILDEINIEEVKFTNADRYWAYFKRDYDYEGIPYEERMTQRSLLTSENLCL